MSKLLKKLLYIIYCKKVKPADFICLYRKMEENLELAVDYIIKNGSGSKPEQLVFNTVGPGVNSGRREEYIELIKIIKKENFKVMCIGDPNYPEDLADIFMPPPLLYYRGELVNRSKFNIAIVGSRRCTHYGREVAAYISRNLSKIGMTIVSGLALGIDSVAHREALREKGGSIAVLGNGLDLVYPLENKSLFNDITASGTVMTEFAPGTPPLKQNFPIRNRIISGLCKGVIIVEAGKRSGAMITGEMALKQNREVFAVPGNIFSPWSRGCHGLIKNGAKLVECIDDILEEFQYLFKSSTGIDNITGKNQGSKNKKQNGNKKYAENNLKLNQLRIYGLIGFQPTSLEKLSLSSGVSAGELVRILSFLEMEELIVEYPANHYRRCD